MLTSLVIFISTFVYWSIFFKKYEENQYPLIIVDGKKAPRLSPLSFHINKSDTDCMSCHVNNQIISINDKNFVINFYCSAIYQIYNQMCALLLSLIHI